MKEAGIDLSTTLPYSPISVVNTPGCDLDEPTFLYGNSSPIANVISTTLNQTFEYLGAPLPEKITTPILKTDCQSSSLRKMTPARYVSTTKTPIKEVPKPETESAPVEPPQTPEKDSIMVSPATPIDQSSSLKNPKDARYELETRDLSTYLPLAFSPGTDPLKEKRASFMKPGVPPDFDLKPKSTHDVLALTNKMLKINGFTTLSNEVGMKDVALLHRTIQEVLLQYEERSKIVQDLVRSKNKSKLEETQEYKKKYSTLETQNYDLKKTIQSLEHHIQEMKEKSEHTVLVQTEEQKAVKTTTQNLKQKITQMEANLKQKEKEIENMKNQIDSFVTKEEQKQKQYKKMFQDLLKRPVRSGGVFQGAIQDAKMLEVISMFETQRALMEKEITFLRDEVSSLNTLLIRANDTICAKPEGHVDMTFINLLNQQHKRAQQESGAPNPQLANAMQSMLENLQIENENLKLELESRPTLSQWRELKNTNAELEQTLHQHLTKAKAKPKKEPKPEPYNLPDSVSKLILEDLCRELHITDVSELLPSIKDMEKAMEILPKMEKFITDVCNMVNEHILQVPEITLNQMNADDIVVTLKSHLADLSPLRKLQTAVINELKRRRVFLEKEYPVWSKASVVQMIKELVENEASEIVTKDAIKQAEEQIKGDPSLLVHQIVKHFQNLFEVKSVEGILPKMNEVYVHTSEVNNVMKTLRSILNLDPSTSINVCLSTVSALVAHVKREKKQNKLPSQIPAVNIEVQQ